MNYKRRIKKPRYLHVADELRNGIMSSQWQPSDLLPSESQLCRNFNVSRGTVVKAIELLLSDGLAHRRQGVGTFVSRPSMHRKPDFLLSFSETVKQQGRTPTHILLDRQELTRAEAMKFDCDEPALMLHRVRLVDSTPWAIHTVIIPQAIAAKIPELQVTDSALENAEFSLYEAMSEAGIAVNHANEAVNTRLANKAESKLLHIDLPSAVILVHRRSFDASDRLVELSEAVYLGECYTYKTRLVRGHQRAVEHSDEGLAEETDRRIITRTRKMWE